MARWVFLQEAVKTSAVTASKENQRAIYALHLPQVCICAQINIGVAPPCGLRKTVFNPLRRSMKLNWAKGYALARSEVEATLAALPAPLRARAQALPVTFERRPSRAQLRDGIEPDPLGLFVGLEFADEESAAVPLPPQIILFLENLWDQAQRFSRN